MEMQSVTVPKLLTVAEAAKLIGKTEAALRWMIHVGTAPKSAVLGHRRVFREADIAAWINAAFGD